MFISKAIFYYFQTNNKSFGHFGFEAYKLSSFIIAKEFFYFHLDISWSSIPTLKVMNSVAQGRSQATPTNSLQYLTTHLMKKK